MKSKVIYEIYTIYEDGIVVNNKTGKQLKPYINKKYGTTTVNILGMKKQLHRLVAEAFLPNPKGYRHIAHIDGDRTNNCSGNLEWCSHSEGAYKRQVNRFIKNISDNPPIPIETVPTHSEDIFKVKDSVEDKNWVPPIAPTNEEVLETYKFRDQPSDILKLLKSESKS